MFTHCNPGVHTMSQNNTGFWRNNNRNQFNSSISMILHDPECTTNQCCSDGELFLKRIYNHSEHSLNVSTSSFDKSIITTNTSKNQILFNTVTSSDDQVPEYQEYVGQAENDKLQAAFPKICNDRQAVGNHFCNNKTKEQRQQRNNCKGVLKRKRTRTVFTTEQIITMEGVFKKRPYVSREERLFLTRKLNVSEKAVKVWFQNRRRVTEYRDSDKNRVAGFEPSEAGQSDSTVEEIYEYDNHSAHLDYIESQINKTTDEYGFVTLDHYSITKLAKIIDTVLSHNIDYSSSSNKNDNSISPNDRYLMYEPISPESLPETNRQAADFMNWIPSPPEESLQRLIDIQTVLSI